MSRMKIAVLVSCVFAMGIPSGCGSGGLLGLPGAQDGMWIFTTTNPSASGTTYIVQISTDRVSSISINGAAWTVTTAFPASRSATDITWKTVATSPNAGIGFQVTKEFDFVVMPQADGSMTGTDTEGISVVAGVSSIQTAMFAISMHRL